MESIAARSAIQHSNHKGSIIILGPRCKPVSEDPYNRHNFSTRDCPRNEFLQRADGVAVTFIPDNDREERAVAKKKRERKSERGRGAGCKGWRTKTPTRYVINFRSPDAVCYRCAPNYDFGVIIYALCPSGGISRRGHSISRAFPITRTHTHLGPARAVRGICPHVV